MTNVRWSYNDGKLISVGGADTALMVWSHAASGSGASDESDTDSEEEGGIIIMETLTNLRFLNIHQ